MNNERDSTKVLTIILILANLIALGFTYMGLQSTQPPETVVESYLIFKPGYEIITTKPTAVWPEGTMLDQGRAAYFYAARPVVNIAPVIEITGVEQGLLEADMHSSVVLQAVNDKGEIFWNYDLGERSLANFILARGIGYQPDKSSFTCEVVPLDILEGYTKALEIGKELAFKRAIFQVLYVTDINLKGTINGSIVEKAIRNILPVTMQEESFTIPRAEEKTIRESLNNRISQALPEQSLLFRINQNRYLIMVNAALLLALLFLIVKSKWHLKKESKEHYRFKEWITEGSVSVNDRLSINIHSLEGLVDLAIDMGKRIIYDTEAANYYVLDENLAYVYNREKTRAYLNKDTNRLGKLLLESGFIKPDQLELGLLYHQKLHYMLGESLIILGFIDENILYSTLAAQAGLTFIELNHETLKLDTCWLENITVNQLRIMEALPLGKRGDGRLVVACSNIQKDGLKEALQEIFKQEIAIVITRPSVIHKALEQWTHASETQKGMSLDYTNDCNMYDDPKYDNYVQRLSNEDLIRFSDSYGHGTVLVDLFLRATGLISQEQLSHVPESFSLLQWFVNRSNLDGDVSHLITGIKKAVAEMDWQLRKDKKTPDLLNVLEKSNYLTAAKIDWLKKEAGKQGLQIEQLLIENFLASAETIQKAKWLLSILKGLI